MLTCTHGTNLVSLGPRVSELGGIWLKNKCPYGAGTCLPPSGPSAPWHMSYRITRDLKVWGLCDPSFDMLLPAHGVLGRHVPCGDPLPALSSIRRSVVSNGVGPIRIRPAVRTLFTEVVGHTGVYTRHHGSYAFTRFIRKKWFADIFKS